jgi:hypothetical protein
MIEWPAALYSAQQLMGEIQALNPPLPAIDATRCLALGLESDAPAALAMLLQSIETLSIGLESGLIAVGSTVGADEDRAACERQRLLRTCMIRGLAAQAIARRCPLADVGPLCGIGMLADIGHLLLRHLVPELMLEADRQARQSGVARYRLERRLIGFDFAEAGAALMVSWALPDRHAVVIGAQTTPRLAGRHQTEARIVRLASQLVDAGLLEAGDADAAAGLALPWQALGLPARSLAEVRSEVCARIDAALDAARAVILHDDASIAG